MNTGILDLSPIEPPGLASRPLGRPVPFPEIVASAGMKNIVTGMAPDVMVYPGTRDFKVPRPGRPIYCIAGATLPTAPRLRAREILRRLAYGFADYPSREVVARYHRDLKRRAPDLDDAARAAVRTTTLRIRRAIEAAGQEGLTVSEIATKTRMAQSNVSRALAAMQQHGLVTLLRDGRSLRVHLNSDRLREITPEPPEAVGPALTLR